jgi:hypothetical protein
MGRGSIAERGVFPPEAAVPPLELLMLALEMAKATGSGGRDAFSVESIDADGQRTTVPLPF